MIFSRFHTYQHCAFLLGLLQLVYLHCSIWPPSSNVALALHPHLKTSYPFSTHFVSSPSAPSPPLMLLAVSLYLLLSLSLPYSLRVFQWNAGGLQARSTKLLHFISSHPVDLIYISRILTLIYLPLFRSLDSLLCDPMAPTPNLVFFLLMSQTLAAASLFSSRRAYPSLSFLPPLFLDLAPTLII